jgi:uncharacterized damage-inducible protein DinB
MPTPYADFVGDQNPVDVLRASLEAYRRVVPALSPAQWQRPWAPGKWTAREIMVHVTQWELIFGVRLRAAVAMKDYAIQPMNQDDLMTIEGTAVDGPTAFAAFDATRAMTIAFAAALSTEQRKKTVTHPERGQIQADDLLVTLAGHPVHHLRQLESILGA